MFRKIQGARGWRAIVACTVAYALALNIILAGVIGASAATEGQLGTAEICLSHVNSNRGLPDRPAHDDSHCVLCLTDANAPVLPAHVGIACTIAPAVALVLRPSQEGIPRAALRDPGKPPRGPPLTA
jgi:hypothetical protein